MLAALEKVCVVVQQALHQQQKSRRDLFISVVGCKTSNPTHHIENPCRFVQDRVLVSTTTTRTFLVHNLC